MTHGRDNQGADRDLLISRVVDARASASDWVELDLLGASDPGVWRELAQAQRDKQLLDEAVERSIACAEHVDLPRGVRSHVPGRRPAGGRMLAWAGWGAAAALALVVWSGGRPATGPVQTAGPSMIPPFTQASSVTPDEALGQYLERGRETGRVVRQLPEFVMIDSAPAPDGSGYDVLYLRQIVERARVESLPSFKVDEFGRRTTLPVRVLQVGPPM